MLLSRRASSPIRCGYSRIQGMGGLWHRAVMMALLKVIDLAMIVVWTLVFDPLHVKTKNFGRQRSATADDLKQRKRSSKYEHSQAIFDSTPLQIYSGHLGAITDLSWSYSHYFLLSASLDQTVRLWNISNTQCLCVNLVILIIGFLSC